MIVYALTWEKFGKLTVLKELGHNKILCKCDCGNTKIMNKSNVKNGHTSSCGCAQHDPRKIVRHSKSDPYKGGERKYRTKEDRKQLIGQRFGRLTVLKECGGGYALCRCDCGNEKKIKWNHLLTGNTKSCGCLNKETFNRIRRNIEGQKFNMLTILKELGHGNILCRCDCGNTKIMNKANVIRGYSKSCGCLHHGCMKPIKRSILKKLPKNNHSGTVGVSWNKWANKWNSKISYKGKPINLGYFDAMDDAVKARKEAEKIYYPDLAES